MGRIRTIKPEFFTHEICGAELTADEALSFIGIWTQADAAGRLEDRPKRLKACLFPHRAIDMAPIVDRLVEVELLIRYQGRALKHDRKGKEAPIAAGEPIALLCIPTFLEHQRPHPKEKINFEGPPAKMPAELLAASGVDSVAGVPVDRLRYDGPEHEPHAVCGRVCLPAFLFEQFVNALGGDQPRARVTAWALVVLRAAASLDAPIAEKPVDWWREAWRAHVSTLAESAKAGAAAKKGGADRC